MCGLFFVFIACMFGLRSHFLCADFAAFSHDAIVRYLQFHPLVPDDMQYLLLPVTCVFVEPLDMAEGLLVDVWAPATDTLAISAAMAVKAVSVFILSSIGKTSHEAARGKNKRSGTLFQTAGAFRRSTETFLLS